MLKYEREITDSCCSDLIQDGKSNYLEGAMLIGTYIIIALAFYVYPDEATGA